MAKKRRTAAQIRATKKLVAMNKARTRGNPKRRRNAAGPRKTPLRRLKSALQLRRGRKATAKWVRSGMPAQRNRAKMRVVSRDFFATRAAAQQYKRRLLPGLRGKITRDKDGTWLVEVTSPYPDAYAPFEAGKSNRAKRNRPRKSKKETSERAAALKAERARLKQARAAGIRRQRYPSADAITHRRNSRGPTLTMAQGRKLYEMGKRAPKTPIALKTNGRKVSIVTGKAARRLAKRS